jgi:hypothetical protein
MRAKRFAWHALLGLLPLLPAAAQPSPVSAGADDPSNRALRLSLPPAPDAKSETIEVPLSFPGSQTVRLHGTTPSWTSFAALTFEIGWPDGAPKRAQVMVYVKDWEALWYQTLLPGYLDPGRQNRLTVDLAPGSAGWESRGHHGLWNLRALARPQEVGLKILSDDAWQGTCTVARAAVTPRAPDGPPSIRRVRAGPGRTACFERFEVAFDLPDRYEAPFDPDSVDVWAEFESPGGKRARADAFFFQDYYRQEDAPRDRLVPQGPPGWRVRFTPTEPGAWRYRLRVKDASGEAQWGPGEFTALAPSAPGFARVSKADPRFFEFDDGSPFFPIGHNVRSSFDRRMDQQFPWARRRDEGAAVYPRYFERMRASGENLVEIWSAAWSLGLEWSPVDRGYHGVGQYNLMHAWEMDRVLESAEHNGIFVNLVINNHGKFSTFSDEEWDANPFNTANGGWLHDPGEFFTDELAFAAFRKLMRYMIARWGYSPNILGWQLWSELDLTGTERGQYMRPEITEWHRRAGRAVREMDPYDHLISTHVAGDYQRQNPEVVALPEIDFAAVDAYYGQADPLRIVALMRATAAYNRRFGKPVLVTEFGGSSMAQGARYLEETLHAALWAAPAVGLVGAPMFWWWQLIDEENYYPRYLALSRFMRGEDRRDPTLRPAAISCFAPEGPAADVEGVCLCGPTKGYGWIFRLSAFGEGAETGGSLSNLTLRIPGLTNGTYAAEFWDTAEGAIIATETARVENGAVQAPLPPLARDMAFKLRRTAGGR